MSMPDTTPMSEPPRRFEVFTGAGRRRIWSEAEKAAIVAESYAGSASVCAVARRHGLSSSQLFTWRRLARQAPAAVAVEPALFVPAVVVPEPPRAERTKRPRPSRRRTKAAAIELVVGGVLVRVGPDAEAGAIAAVIQALKAQP